MADTYTTNYGFVKPAVGPASTGWPTKLNNNFDAIDSSIKGVENLVMLEHTFYVDAVNGSDSNDGSQEAPFATIKKAVDVVPFGGYGFIHLISGQTYTINSDINIINKKIVIYGSTIKNVSFNTSNGYTETYGFKILNGQICFQFCNLITANYANGTSGLSDWEGFIKRIDHAFGSSQLYSCDVTLGDTDLVRLSPGPATLFVDFFNVNITRVGTNRTAYVVYNEGGVFGLGVKSAALPSGTTWNDFIYGIVKDANGVPRNVVSNIVL